MERPWSPFWWRPDRRKVLPSLYRRADCHPLPYFCRPSIRPTIQTPDLTLLTPKGVLPDKTTSQIESDLRTGTGSNSMPNGHFMAAEVVQSHQSSHWWPPNSICRPMGGNQDRYLGPEQSETRSHLLIFLHILEILHSLPHIKDNTEAS